MARGRICRVCGWRPARAKGLCATDYRYRARTGRDRPEDLVVRHGQRVLERAA